MDTTKKNVSPGLVVTQLLFVVASQFIPMILSGDWRWIGAWLYAISTILVFFISRAFAARRHPDLLVERAGSMQAKDTKPWDKVLAPVTAFGTILTLVAAGLDHQPGETAVFSTATRYLAFGMMLLGYWFSSWALVENRFFSGTVRIQTERGHQAVTTGPYRFVRHPGYAGALISYLFTPVLLDSLWGLLMAFLLGVAIVVRTALEDRTLQAELPGYREFAAKTRYRLVPGVW